MGQLTQIAKRYEDKKNRHHYYSEVSEFIDAYARQNNLDKEAIEKLLIGLDKTADAVSGTFGPKGKNVYLYDKGILKTKITNDGVTVANEVLLEDSAEDAGSWIMTPKAERHTSTWMSCLLSPMQKPSQQAYC